MKKLTYSIIVPAYNEEKYILNCLWSLKNLNFPQKNLEIIVVDNNSNDRTVALVKKFFPKVKVYQEKKQGVVFARIKGIKKAKGEIIVFIDADSIASRDWLKNLHQAYRNPNLVAIGGLVQFYPRTFFILMNQLSANFYHLLQIMPGSNMSFRRWAIINVVVFRPR